MMFSERTTAEPSHPLTRSTEYNAEYAEKLENMAITASKMANEAAFLLSDIGQLKNIKPAIPDTGDLSKEMNPKINFSVNDDDITISIENVRKKLKEISDTTWDVVFEMKGTGATLSTMDQILKKKAEMIEDTSSTHTVYIIKVELNRLGGMVPNVTDFGKIELSVGGASYPVYSTPDVIGALKDAITKEKHTRRK